MMRSAPWIAGLAVLALGACASGPAPEGRTGLTPTENYAIKVNPAPLELKLAAHSDGLSPAQVEALRAFVGDWRDAGGAEITLKAPEHGPDRDAAYRTTTDARDFLVSQGVQPEKLRVVGYEAGGDAKAPVLIGFVRYEAKGPNCGQSWSDITNISDNREYPEFGCAVTANIAAQIAYPADLLQPQASDPPDAQRRQSVTDAYRKPAITSTPKDTQADGTLAAVGQ
ncbi:MAG TPA: CpaD family pilus assembly protein [Caulobacteraceae bacterium]|nr:CpaD family pilus assembly protein [Caulobacteraceae bacterium]